MKRFILAILTLFIGTKLFGKDRPKGAYRTPGEIEEGEAPPKPVEPKKERKWLQDLKRGLNNMSYDDFLSKAWKTLAGLVAIAAISFGFFIGGSLFLAKGNVDYCYIERWTYIKEAYSGIVKPMDNSGPVPQERIADKVPDKNQTVVIVYELKGHRNWRSDRDIGRFDSLEAAIEGSHKLNCAVEAK